MIDTTKTWCALYARSEPIFYRQIQAWTTSSIIEYKKFMYSVLTMVTISGPSDSPGEDGLPQARETAGAPRGTE